MTFSDTAIIYNSIPALIKVHIMANDFDYGIDYSPIWWGEPAEVWSTIHNKVRRQVRVQVYSMVYFHIYAKIGDIHGF